MECGRVGLGLQPGRASSACTLAHVAAVCGSASSPSVMCLLAPVIDPFQHRIIWCHPCSRFTRVTDYSRT